MALTIDWDNYEVIESDDYTMYELEQTIEDVREWMDLMAAGTKDLHESMLELLMQLTDMQEEKESQHGK